MTDIDGGPYRVFVRVVILVLACGLTIASLRYVRPTNCQQLCSADPCPKGYCRFGEQRAGFPFPVLVDSRGGGSPISGWGKLGPEDPPLPFTFGLDVLFYGIILWLIWKGMFQAMQRKHRRRA